MLTAYFTYDGYDIAQIIKEVAKEGVKTIILYQSIPEEELCLLNLPAIHNKNQIERFQIYCNNQIVLADIATFAFDIVTQNINFPYQFLSTNHFDYTLEFFKALKLEKHLYVVFTKWKQLLIPFQYNLIVKTPSFMPQAHYQIVNIPSTNIKSILQSFDEKVIYLSKDLETNFKMVNELNEPAVQGRISFFLQRSPLTAPQCSDFMVKLQSLPKVNLLEEIQKVDQCFPDKIFIFGDSYLYEKYLSFIGFDAEHNVNLTFDETRTTSYVLFKTQIVTTHKTVLIACPTMAMLRAIPRDSDVKVIQNPTSLVLTTIQQIFDDEAKQFRLAQRLTNTTPKYKPCDMLSKQRKVVIDVREQRSLVQLFLHCQGYHVQMTTLDVGDYVLDAQTAVERKSLGDLTSSIISGRIALQLEKQCLNFPNSWLLVETSEPIPSEYAQKLFGYLTLFKNLRVVQQRSAYLFLAQMAKKVNDFQLSEAEPVSNDKLIQFLQKITFLTGKNRSSLLAKFTTVYDLINASSDVLKGALGAVVGERLFGLFNDK